MNRRLVSTNFQRGGGGRVEPYESEGRFQLVPDQGEEEHEAYGDEDHHNLQSNEYSEHSRPGAVADGYYAEDSAYEHDGSLAADSTGSGFISLKQYLAILERKGVMPALVDRDDAIDTFNEHASRQPYPDGHLTSQRVLNLLQFQDLVQHLLSSRPSDGLASETSHVEELSSADGAGRWHGESVGNRPRRHEDHALSSGMFSTGRGSGWEDENEVEGGGAGELSEGFVSARSGEGEEGRARYGQVSLCICFRVCVHACIFVGTRTV
jgi:hypothetical protein